MITTTNLKETAYEYVKKLILDRSLEDGVVYSERKISSEIGVSRTPFHSALQQLESEGYIDILPSRGFTIHHMNTRDVEETFEIRSAIEFFCVYTLTEDFHNHTERSIATLKELKYLLRKQEEIFSATADIEDFVVYDFSFHETIVRYQNNPTFNGIYKAHMYKIQNLACKSLAHEGRMQNTLDEHKAIIRAIENGDKNELCEVTMRHFNTPKYINLKDIM